MEVKQFMTDGIEALTPTETVLNASRLMKNIMSVRFLSSMKTQKSLD